MCAVRIHTNELHGSNDVETIYLHIEHSSNLWSLFYLSVHVSHDNTFSFGYEHMCAQGIRSNWKRFALLEQRQKKRGNFTDARQNERGENRP